MKEKSNHYHFYATPLHTPAPSGKRDEREKEILALCKAYIVETEKIVNQYPLQWFNYYDFWKIDNSSHPQ